MEYSKEEALERQVLTESILNYMAELGITNKAEPVIDWDDSKEAELEAVDGYENWSDPAEWEDPT